MKKGLSLLIVMLFSLTLFALGDPDAIVGVWASSSNKGHIRIYKNAGKYYGKIVWLKQPYDTLGKPKVDHKNPNKDARNKKLVGLIMLRDFEYEDEQWKGGRIYNPEDGKEYKCNMKLKDSKTLSVRGYMGFSLIGKTKTFKRVK
jgi:uncharacterized protein (DUF2147 family)